MERVVQNERQCWANAQYSCRDTVEVVGIPLSIRDQNLQGKVQNIFEEMGVNIDEHDILACHRFREKDRTIVKFVNWKYCTSILWVKKNLKDLDPSKLSFSEGTKIFINESLSFLVNLYSSYWLNNANVITLLSDLNSHLMIYANKKCFVFCYQHD